MRSLSAPGSESAGHLTAGKINIVNRYNADPEIAAITADSRQVKSGSLFAALAGSAVDGRRFINEAIGKGAAVILTDPAGAQSAGDVRIPLIVDQNPRHRLAVIASCLYASQPGTVAAVTGTNGKTSTAVFTRQLWAYAKRSAASIGTLGIEGPDGLIPGNMTTPDPIVLHEVLADLAAKRVGQVVMEASSHGLEQYRLDGVRIAAAAFTNLTQDHLDYHGTMEAYFAAKLRLFRDVLARGGVAVLNADSPHYFAIAETARGAGHLVMDYGKAAQSIKLLSATPAQAGQHLEIEVMGRRRRILLPLMGGFQAMNTLAALGLAIATGVDPEEAMDGLERLQGVRGRIEQVATLPNGAAIFVDYAHTPDGLEKVMGALRPHAKRLVAVFGAGGDRDRTKRPLMGAMVAKLADHAIVTDDNPRGEDPAAIRAEILADCPGAKEIGDRAAAIEHGIGLLQAGDVLVIAGKGHEQGQTVAGVTHPFDDASVARGIVAALTDGSHG